jgi:hypothetical protein
MMTATDTGGGGKPSRRLPASTLELLLSMLTAGPGAGTARKWADDMLTPGASSDALVELALLGGHEAARAAALLPRALRDAGIETEPRGPLLLLFYRLLLLAWLDGRVEVGEFALLLETCLACEPPGTEGIDADKKDALDGLMRTLALHRACHADREACPVPVEKGEVAAAARTAFARLNA